MDSIVNKLTEIEDAASAIVAHAETQKEILDREYEEKRKAFDAELEKQTQARINAIRDDLEKSTSGILDSQNGASTETIRELEKEYEERHAEYARELLTRITEVSTRVQLIEYSGIEITSLAREVRLLSPKQFT